MRTEERWLRIVNSDTSRKGNGLNKLRTYKLFKSNFGVEMYVSTNLPRKHRKAMVLFRAGVAPINIELMSYGPGKRPVEERKCLWCKDNIENECHAITQRPQYSDIRELWFHQLCSQVAHFNNLSDLENLCFVLSDTEFLKINAKACYDILERRKDMLYNLV